MTFESSIQGDEQFDSGFLGIELLDEEDTSPGAAGHHLLHKHRPVQRSLLKQREYLRALP